MTKIEALAKYLGAEIEDIKVSSMYNRQCFEYDINEYLVLTDKEADEACKENILELLWAFNADFIASYTKNGLTNKAIIALKKMQQELCENANDIVAALIEEMDAFVQDAMNVDGRGHFLAQYDSEENVEGEFFIYQVN